MARQKKRHPKPMHKAERIIWIVYTVVILLFQVFLFSGISIEGNDPASWCILVFFALLFYIAPIIRLIKHIKAKRALHSEAVFCGKCGAGNAITSRFCTSCGTELFPTPAPEKRLDPQPDQPSKPDKPSPAPTLNSEPKPEPISDPPPSPEPLTRIPEAKREESEPEPTPAVSVRHCPPGLEKLTVFDVETPNQHNDRICSIGIVRIEEGNIVFSDSCLIDPECEFSPANIQIHGIDPYDIVGKPTISDIWITIRHYFYDSVVIAHNASFDLSVLKKALYYKGIYLQPLRFLDTLTIARKLYPGLPNYKLPTICDTLNIDLQHHEAGSDALATARIVLDMFEHGLNSSFIQDYHPVLFDDLPKSDSFPSAEPPIIRSDVFPSSDPSFEHSIDPMDLMGKKVVITGSFLRGSKDDVTNDLHCLGAIVQSNVTESTSLLLVGAKGNSQWKYRTHGAKVQKALEMQAHGHPIQIIREEDFF